jgi:hypothetical protein
VLHHALSDQFFVVSHVFAITNRILEQATYEIEK